MLRVADVGNGVSCCVECGGRGRERGRDGGWAGWMIGVVCVAS